MRFSTSFIALLLTCLLPACGHMKKKKAPPAEEAKTTLVGIVDMVNPEQNYVLIRCEQMLAMGAGTELIALDATGAEAKLKLTPERKGRYLTADIKEGTPRVANLVILRKSGNTPLSPTSGPVPIAQPGAIPMTPGMPSTPSLAPSSISLDPQAPMAPMPVTVPAPTAAPYPAAPEPSPSDLPPPVQ